MVNNAVNITDGSKPTIVIVDDEPDFLKDLVSFFTKKGYEAQGVSEGSAIGPILDERKVDLVILDLLMPGESGLQIADRLRHASGVGILILSNLSEAETQLAAFEVGADAYLTKGTDLFVIEATVKSIIRRVKDTQKTVFEVDKPTWEFDATSWCLVAPNKQSVELNASERAIVECLFKQSGNNINRPVLLQEIGKADTVENLRYLDVIIQRLRHKVKTNCQMSIPIKGVYGKGYVFINKA